MQFIILMMICFTLGLILSKTDDKTKQILTRIEELDKKIMLYNRSSEYSFTAIQNEIKTIKELVGEDNA